MKFITKYILILVIGTMLIGCDSFLEEEPKAITSPDTFFKTIEEFELAINGLYDTWGQDYCTAPSACTDSRKTVLISLALIGILGR